MRKTEAAKKSSKPIDIIERKTDTTGNHRVEELGRATDAPDPPEPANIPWAKSQHTQRLPGATRRAGIPEKVLGSSVLSLQPLSWAMRQSSLVHCPRMAIARSRRPLDKDWLLPYRVRENKLLN
jgi:hypothetical protein